MKIKRRLSQLLFAAVAAVSLSLGYWLNQNTAGPQLPAVSNEFDATVFPEARELIPFKLQDHNGKPFTPHNLKHKWSLIFFGYTHCPDVCPTTLKVLQDFWSGLAEGLRNKTGVVFVTVDPNRDKAEELKQYISYFNPEFVGVTGNLGHITAFTRSLGILYEYVRMGKEKDS